MPGHDHHDYDHAGHDHGPRGHQYHAPPAGFDGAFAIGSALNAGFVLAEVVGDLNVRGAFLHMAADAAVSAGVVVSGLVILLTGWAWLDPVVSLGISALILFSTWSLLRDSLNLALDKVPEGVDAGKVLAYLAALPGVTEVHDLHIWPLSTTETALTAHLVRSQAGTDDAFVHDACEELRKRFGIGHATLQIEDGDPAHARHLAPADVV